MCSSDLGNKVEDLLMFNAKSDTRAFNENGSGLAGRINGNSKKRVKGYILFMGEGHGAAS